jgi:hypothetical protein
MLSKLTLEVLTLSVKVALVCLVPLNTCWIVILQYIYILTISIIKDFFCEIFFPFGNKKKGHILYKGFILEKDPFWVGKKELNLPYLDHRFLYVSNVHHGLKKIIILSMILLWIIAKSTYLTKMKPKPITILYVISLKADFYFY